MLPAEIDLKHVFTWRQHVFCFSASQAPTVSRTALGLYWVQIATIEYIFVNICYAFGNYYGSDKHGIIRMLAIAGVDLYTVAISCIKLHTVGGKVVLCWPAGMTALYCRGSPKYLKWFDEKDSCFCLYAYSWWTLILFTIDKKCYRGAADNSSSLEIYIWLSLAPCIYVFD